MDGERVTIEDDTMEAGDQIEQPEAEKSEPEQPEDDSNAETEPAAEPEPEDMMVTIGDESSEEEAEPAPNWVKDLRKKQRETAKENRRLKAELEAKAKPETVQVGPKPTLEACDYDAEQFEQKLTAWYDTKRQADAQQQQQKAKEKEQQDAWQSQLNRYEEAKIKLKAKVRGFDEAEEVVRDYLNETQQGIIVQGANDAAMVVAALGGDQERIERLAAIKDPVKFAFEIARLETSMTVKTRKAPPPPPETRPSGTASTSGAVDSTLDRLRKEAVKTGDMSPVIAYKRKLKQAR